MIFVISIKTILKEWQNRPNQITAIELLDLLLEQTGTMAEDKLWARLWQSQTPAPMLNLRAEIPENWETLFEPIEAQKRDFAAIDENLAQNKPVLLKILEPGLQWDWILCFGKSNNQTYTCLNSGETLAYSREALVANWTTNGPGSGISKTLG